MRRVRARRRRDEARRSCCRAGRGDVRGDLRRIHRRGVERTEMRRGLRLRGARLRGARLCALCRDGLRDCAVPRLRRLRAGGRAAARQNEQQHDQIDSQQQRPSATAQSGRPRAFCAVPESINPGIACRWRSISDFLSASRMNDIRILAARQGCASARASPARPRPCRARLEFASRLSRRR